VHLEGQLAREAEVNRAPVEESQVVVVIEAGEDDQHARGSPRAPTASAPRCMYLHSRAGRLLCQTQL
jgi:hypothetical protein